MLGGMFDPVHAGHLAAARYALRTLSLDLVKLVPCREPCHRPAAAASAAQRLAMLELAVADDCGLAVDDLELRRPGVSYTVDTLAALHAAHPDGVLVFILGADAFAGFTGWREWRRILQLACMFVLPRAGRGGEGMDDTLKSHLRESQEELFRDESDGIYIDRDFSEDVSSAALRDLLAGVPPTGSTAGCALVSPAPPQGGSDCFSDLLPAAVLDYIYRHQLYGVSPSASVPSPHHD